MVAKHGFFQTNGNLHHSMQYMLPLDDLLIHIAAVTDVGKKRKENEDNCVLQDNVLVVCDGMGGHAKGEVASKMACDYFAMHSNDAVSLDEIAYGAHQHVFTEAQNNTDTAGMGCTAVVARFLNTKTIECTNVGDSRAYVYCIKKGEPHIRQLTEDHSLVWQMYKEGRITKDEMAHKNISNIVTACIGSEEDGTFPREQIKQYQRRIRPGDVYLLCSDGLWDMLTDNQIATILTETYAKYGRNDPTRDAAAAQALIDAANAAGGKDNITVALARISREPFSFSKMFSKMYTSASNAFFAWFQSKVNKTNKTPKNGKESTPETSIQEIYAQTLEAFFAKDYDRVADVVQTHRDQFLAAQTSKADFLLGVAALQNNYHRDAIASFENCLAHASKEERSIADTSYFPHAVRSLAYAYAKAYRGPRQRRTFLKKAATLRQVPGVQGTPLSTEIEQALHYRVQDIGEQLIKGFYEDAVREPLLTELHDFAQVIGDSPELQNKIMEVYRRAIKKAVHRHAQFQNDENEIIDLKNEIQYLRETNDQTQAIAGDNERLATACATLLKESASFQEKLRSREVDIEAQLQTRETDFEELLRQYQSLCDAFARRGKENATLDQEQTELKRKYRAVQKNLESSLTRTGQIRTYIFDIFTGIQGLVSQWGAKRDKKELENAQKQYGAELDRGRMDNLFLENEVTRLSAENRSIQLSVQDSNTDRLYHTQPVEKQESTKTNETVQEKQPSKYEHLKQTALAVAESVGKNIHQLWQDLLQYRERREFDGTRMELRDVRSALQDVQHAYDTTRRLHGEAAQANNRLYAQNCTLREETEMLQKQLAEATASRDELLRHRLQEQCPAPQFSPDTLPPITMTLPAAASRQEDVSDYIAFLKQRHNNKR